MKTFGPAWSRALVEGCTLIRVPPEWVLAVLLYESGLDPERLHANASLVPATGPDDMRPEVAGSGGLRLSKGSGARGLFQKMPTVERRDGLPPLMRLYAERDPVRQLRDAFQFWNAMIYTFRAGVPKSRAAFYCVNLAPARLKDGAYTDETVLYGIKKDASGNIVKSSAYWMNRGLDVDGDGAIQMRELEPILVKAVEQNRTRFDAELAAAYVSNLAG